MLASFFRCRVSSYWCLLAPLPLRLTVRASCEHGMQSDVRPIACLRLAPASRSRTLIVACLQKNGRNLLLLDRSFRLEVSWWIKIKERSGEQIVQRKLLDLLPSMDAPKAMESTIAECRAFEASELGRTLPGVGSGSAHALIEIASNLQKGIPLAMAPGDSPCVRDVAARLVFPNVSLKLPHRLLLQISRRDSPCNPQMGSPQTKERRVPSQEL